jgi:predicted nucleic-acid-binding protein
MTDKPAVLDTNILIRLVTADIPEQSSTAKEFIDSHECIVYLEVLAEVVYVLTGYYEYTREEIKTTIDNLIVYKLNLIDKENVVSHAAKLFSESSLDFVDCLLAGYQKVNETPVFTFDKALNKQMAK